MYTRINSSSPLQIWNEFLISKCQNYADLAKLHATKQELFTSDINLLKQRIAKFKQDSPKKEDLSYSYFKWMIYRMLCTAGAIYAACSGFDGMISVLSILFPHLYLGLIIVFGVVSALSGLGIFIARDKPSIAEELGVKETSGSSGIDAYLLLLQQYLHLKKKEVTNKGLEANQNIESIREQFLELQHQLKPLEALYQEVTEGNKKHIASWQIYAESQVVLLIAAVLFFSDGFFVGEAIAIFFASLLNINPVFFSFAVATLLGCFALAAYCFVERPSLKEYLYGTFFTNQSDFEQGYEELEEDLGQIQLLGKLSAPSR